MGDSNQTATAAMAEGNTTAMPEPAPAITCGELRERAHWLDERGEGNSADCMRQAADALAALSAEAERLRQDKEEWSLTTGPESLRFLYSIRSAIGWNNKTSLSILPDGCRRLLREKEQADAAAAAVPAMLKALRAFRDYGCPVCHGDCASANPPVSFCPMQMASAAILKATTPENL